ncbi:MAG: hypothetical protein SFZ23_07515 [Planctomycetota bacterium]|nr:hypothetical protein [Planctomycetota bacterium]
MNRLSARSFPCRNALVGGLALVGLSAGLLGGCTYNTPSEEYARDIRMDPSPEVDTLYQREVDIDNALTLTFDENLRALNQDLGRFFLLDRPSRLTLEPNRY